MGYRKSARNECLEGTVNRAENLKLTISALLHRCCASSVTLELSMIFSLLAGALFSSGEGLDGEFPVAPKVEGPVKVGAKFDTKTEAFESIVPTSLQSALLTPSDSFQIVAHPVSLFHRKSPARLRINIRRRCAKPLHCAARLSLRKSRPTASSRSGQQLPCHRTRQRPR